MAIPKNSTPEQRTYARILFDQDTYHAALQRVITIPKGTRVEVLAVDVEHDKFFGMYTEGAADCTIQCAVHEVEECPAETDDEFNQRGVQAVIFLQLLAGIEEPPERALAEFKKMSASERDYTVKVAARLKLLKETKPE